VTWLLLGEHFTCFANSAEQAQIIARKRRFFIAERASERELAARRSPLDGPSAAKSIPIAHS
jgi:hypothetical protein